MENIRIIIYNVTALVIFISFCDCQCHNVTDCFQDLIPGRYNKNIVKSKFVNRYSDCFRECERHSSDCKSFNYQIFSGFCELSSDVPAAGEIYPEDGSVHSLIPNNPDSTNPCSSSSCGASEVCVALTSGSTTCVKECGNTITAPNIQVVSADIYYTPGEQVHITCNPGYDKITDITCLPSGKWSDTGLCVMVCGFETCCVALESDPTSNHEFIHNSGATQSLNTGCSEDHTTATGNGAGGKYYYLKATNMVAGDVSRMISTSTFQAGVQVCMRLWYHMYGTSMGSLHIYTKNAGGAFMDSFLVAEGNQGQSWFHALKTIPPQAEGFLIVLEARRGPGTESDICIDDVSIFRC